MTLIAAEKQQVEPLSVTGRRVLVAEDSPITHELLKLLLSQRGHEVDIATDGVQALEAMRTRDYDVALLDFHLPHMDGLQVASAVKRGGTGHKVPRLIAITADVEGLLAGSEGCENFDHIIPKPLDIYEVGRLVEEQAALGAEGPASDEPKPVKQLQLPQRAARSPPSYLDGLGYQFLVWPDDLEATRFSARAMQATLGDPRFDAILIKKPASAEGLATIWRHKALYALPVIDLTGTLGARADLDTTKLKAGETGELATVIRHFQDRRARLHRDLLFSLIRSEQLLGRVFVSGVALTPSFDPASRSFVTYNTTLENSVALHDADLLCERGLFKRKFFDRFYVCRRCDSTRMHVREECAKCRSADLVEEPYLHHFKCAYQGPESGFRHGDMLVCPKCRRELLNFGYDYDRPGTMIVCRVCGHGASEPAIGFVCIDCAAGTDAEASPTRDVFSYELTEQGEGFAQFGQAALGTAQHALRFAELPMELVVALNAAAKRFNDDKIPFTLINIFYDQDREITAKNGAREFAQARDLFIENMRAALAKGDMVVKGQSYDFALLQKMDPTQARAISDDMRERAQKTVKFDLGARFQAFGPEDFS